MVFLANFFFLERVEPEELSNLYDKLLSLFLFQFDYFLLFSYILLKTLKFPKSALLWLGLVYGSLFVLGMSSIVFTEIDEFDVYYSYIQPVLRLIIMGVFLNIGLKTYAEVSKFDLVFLILGLTFGFYFLNLLNSYPRPSMWSFNFYWLALMSFFIVGVLVKCQKERFIFILGLTFVLLSDLYYILPPEVRMYELTYIFIRIINSIGEFLIVRFVLGHFIPSNK